MKRILLSTLAFLCAIISQAQPFTFHNDNVEMVIDGRGYITSLKVCKQEMLLNGAQPFVAALFDDDMAVPFLAEKIDSQLAIKMNDGGGLFFNITASQAALTIELAKAPTRYDAVLLLPIAVTPHDIIGEMVGVVQNSKVAMGIQALNPKTCAGFPSSYQTFLENAFHYTAHDVPFMKDALPASQLAAAPIAGGARFQFYCCRRDDSTHRALQHTTAMPILVLDDDEGSTRGAKIALFGCTPKDVLSTISSIEQEHGLPHPTINGQWDKIAPDVKHGFIRYGHDNSNDTQRHRTQAFILKSGYMPVIDNAFSSWGHYPLGEETLLWSASSYGVVVHGNRITTNDSLITPTPTEHLLKRGSIYLAEKLHPDQQSFCIAYDDQLETASRHLLQIGNELIVSGTVEEDADGPYLNGCTRGAYGTHRNTYNVATTLDLLWVEPDTTLVPDLTGQDLLAMALAQRCTDNGIATLLFDDMEGFDLTGHHDYAVARYFEQYWKTRKQMPRSLSNRLTHYGWHATSLFHNEAPALEHANNKVWNDRLHDLTFYDRNLLPRTLGTVTLHAASHNAPCPQLEELEWALSKAIAYDANLNIQIDDDFLEHCSIMEAISSSINDWNKLQNLSPAIKKQLATPNSFWHLKTIGSSTIHLYPLEIRDSIADFRTSEEFRISIANAEQYSLQIRPEDDNIIQEATLICSNDTLTFTEVITSGTVLQIDYDGRISITDLNHTIKKELGQLTTKDNKKPEILIFRCKTSGSNSMVNIRYCERKRPMVITL